MITIEFRSRIREHGYSLVRQQDVREAAARAGVYGPPTVTQLARIGEDLNASVVFSPLLTGHSGEGTRIELLAVRTPDQALGPISEPLESLGDQVTGMEVIEQTVASLINRLLEPLPATSPATSDEQEVELVDDGHDQPQPADDHGGNTFDKYDHEGVIADLAFMLPFCHGDTMCHGVNPGYGARLRLGYRIKALFSVSVTGVIVGHNVPITTDAGKIARTDRALIWTGVYGGARYHPINRHLIDPFIGLDMGWTWILYTELVTGTGEDVMSYMGVQINELYERRNSLSLNGFTFNPHIGLRFFIRPSVSVGLLLNFLLPIWREACVKFKTWSLGEKIDTGDKCTKIDHAGTDFIEMEHGELSDRGELPWFLDMEVDLALTF